MGLILREREHRGDAWALIGGRVHLSETLTDAIDRHLTTTLGSGISWQSPNTASPSLVAEYFPRERPGHGVDLRKHAIALTYVVDIEGDPSPTGEALEFKWFTARTLPAAPELWSGQHAVVRQLLNGQPSSM